MIGFFLKSGDKNVEEMFSPYLWGDHGIAQMLKKGLAEKEYSKELKLILIQFLVEGTFDIGLPNEPNVGRYSQKEKAISVKIPIRKSDFHNVDEIHRRDLIIASMDEALWLVKGRCRTAGLKVRFEDLKKDLDDILLRFKESQSLT